MLSPALYHFLSAAPLALPSVVASVSATDGPALDLGYEHVFSMYNTSSDAPEDPILDLGYAKYLGYYNATSDINYFNGIHYAQPPIGELRWQSPRDIELKNNYSEMGIINATDYGPACVQGIAVWAAPFLVGYPTGVEDCLLLNIQAPAHPESDTLPILIWIHGGGHTMGFSSSVDISGEEMIVHSNGAFIWVAIQYRLGAYGFLSSAEIQSDGVANAALLDQRAAIRWVYRHAKAFGGDPNAITIYGGSAGAECITAQLILHGGEEHPPFRAAIAEFPWQQTFKSPEILEQQYKYLLDASGCTGLICLRSLSEDDLRTATHKAYEAAFNVPQGYGYSDFWFGPSVDGVTIRDYPSREFKAGHFAKVPVLTDRSGYEGALFVDPTLTEREPALQAVKNLFPAAPQPFWERIEEIYPLSSYPNTFNRSADIIGDMLVNCPTHWMASAVSDAGLAAYKLLFYAGYQMHSTTANYLLFFHNNYGTYMHNDTIGTWRNCTFRDPRKTTKTVSVRYSLAAFWLMESLKTENLTKQ